MNLIRQTLVFASLCAMGIVIYVDSAPHFDRESIGKKRAVWSAQRNWNLFLGQDYIYRDTSIRYEQDLLKIAELTSLNEVAFADLATSYYLASHTPLAVKNIHLHQGRNADRSWRQLLERNDLCFIDKPERLARVQTFIANSARLKRQSFDYIVINKDSSNYNLKRDCFSRRWEKLEPFVAGVSKLLYQGEFLNLYLLN